MATFRGDLHGRHPATVRVGRSLGRLGRPVTVADVGQWSGRQGRAANDQVARLLSAGILAPLPLKGAYVVFGAPSPDHFTILRAWLRLHPPIGRDFPGQITRLERAAMYDPQAKLWPQIPNPLRLHILKRYSSAALKQAQAELAAEWRDIGLYEVRRVAELEPTKVINGLPFAILRES